MPFRAVAALDQERGPPVLGRDGPCGGRPRAESRGTDSRRRTRGDPGGRSGRTRLRPISRSRLRADLSLTDRQRRTAGSPPPPTSSQDRADERENHDEHPEPPQPPPAGMLASHSAIGESTHKREPDLSDHSEGRDIQAPRNLDCRSLRHWTSPRPFRDSPPGNDPFSRKPPVAPDRGPRLQSRRIRQSARNPGGDPRDAHHD